MNNEKPNDIEMSEINHGLTKIPILETEISNSISIETNAEFDTCLWGLLEYVYIGKVMGFFPDNFGVPRVYIGPTWQFALPIVTAVLFLTYFLGSILYYLQSIHIGIKLVVLVMMLYNLYCYFFTLFANPGIP